MDRIYLPSNKKDLKLVPWKNWKQWELIFRDLYNNNTSAQIEAIKIVNSWIARGRAPAAIEATAMLMELLLKYNKNNNSNINNELEARLSISMALVRFVNGTFEASQKGTFARPLSTIGQEIGFPTHLIDLRHDATHKSLPCLSILLRSLQDALQWIYNNYWLKQFNLFINTRNDTIRVLDDYQSFQFQHLDSQSKHKSNNTTNNNNNNILNDLFSQITPVIISNMNDLLIPLLLDENYLIRSNSSKNKIHKELPSKYKIVWKPLLLFCQKQNPSFILYLSYYLIDSLFNIDIDISNKNLHNRKISLRESWLCYLMDDNDYFENKEEFTKEVVIYKIIQYYYTNQSFQSSGYNNQLLSHHLLKCYTQCCSDNGSRKKFSSLLKITQETISITNKQDDRLSKYGKQNANKEVEYDVEQLENLISLRNKKKNEQEHWKPLLLTKLNFSCFELPISLDSFSFPKPIAQKKKRPTLMSQKEENPNKIQRTKEAIEKPSITPVIPDLVKTITLLVPLEELIS